ncbi:MAG: HAMP domain-containing histidine kinase [Epsilonproteobacteria bacterium]|nr:HAMP domain-containing histidine kinase [Campylobacterota bacterium]
MRNSDLAAFIVLYISSIAILALVLFFWYELFRWNHLWFLGVLLVSLSILFGYLFARYALTPLAERNEKLDNLLKDTLHELNIPVATIKANVQMLKRGEREERSLKRIGRIEKAVAQLLALYDEVDYLIKREIDRIPWEEVDLERVIRERVAFFDDLKGKRKIVVDLEPTPLFLPRHGFIKTFDNLLSNAIKYSPDGSSISILLKGGILKVTDQGSGIESSELVKIFDRYYRAHKGGQGYGIGLDIVKRFCDEVGIKIMIESQPGVGTEVTLDLTDLKGPQPREYQSQTPGVEGRARQSG